MSRVMVPGCDQHRPRTYPTQVELKAEAARRVEAGDRQTQCRQCKGWFYPDQIHIKTGPPAL